MQSEVDELLTKIRKWVKEAPRNEETYQKMKTIQGHLMGIIDDEPSKPKAVPKAKATSAGSGLIKPMSLDSA